MPDSPRRRPTIRDVAKRAGVSKSLVSLVLSDPSRVSSLRRSLVEDSIRELGYQPNLAARSLVAANRHAIGVVLGELHNPWVLTVAEVVREQLQAVGCDVLFSAAAIHDGLGVGPAELQALRDLRVSGILVVGSADDAASFEAALGETPAVFVGSGRQAQSNTAAVSVDDEQGFGLVIDHLVHCGNERIIHIAGGAGPVSAVREAAYHRAMLRHGLRQQVQVVEAGPTVQAGYEAVVRLLASGARPEALACFNDLSAFGALQALDEAGLSAAVTGYDNISLSSLGRISLTSVDSDSQDIGRSSVRLLLQLMRNPDGKFARQLMIPPRLIVRSSSLPRR
ncbi:LacI family transcriptional regulator [Arthrobacter sp. MYb224]|uniref:LacI family DNA-binding transcriptional regulator n=1 Tax=unclassified Arthrobacter TaxID=235627 RepID=UPI000CFE0EF4|nr:MULTISPECIES: LacI family DNA-binding transcriptional regulator [unclassified Arthrobacter]PQZ97594.1 LacI family transcriptional regulator [Arthrobacter sp. MYb224]PRA04175.1 LacI family transcriptional regulator [Arthrobacter sp. MYb229]PRB51913.1 LacI family transcriptional regulator [Arthrobacter sp. MYb216]